MPGTSPGESCDYLILGAGWGGLAAASLLAKAGHRVAVLEAQDRAGGCGQSFAVDGFSFCAEMQYLMECGPGGVVDRWLTALDLQDPIEFNAFDPDGYDRIELPGFGMRIPCDPRRFQQSLVRAFPDEAEKIGQLFAVLFEIESEFDSGVFDAAHVLAHPLQFKSTLLYGVWSVRRVFDFFGLSPRLGAILAGQCGDIGLSPRDEPFFCLYSILFGYCRSAHFPKKGMGHFVDRIVESITGNGGQVHFDTPVTGIDRDGSRVTAVHTPRGTFTARTVVSNIDPATTMAMIEGATVPQYEPSTSCFTIFLGVDIDLSQQGFGRSNVWNYPSEDLDEAIGRTVDGHLYDDPFFFLSTPSLVADPGVLAPAGGTTIQINVASSFDFFETAENEGRHEAEKERVAAEILRAVERRLIPGLTQHIVVREVWSPLDLARRTGLPRGGMYGARLDFMNRVVRRVAQQTDFENLFLTGATAGGPGLQGVVAASLRLVDSLRASEEVAAAEADPNAEVPAGQG